MCPPEHAGTRVAVLGVGRPTFDLDAGTTAFAAARRVIAGISGIEVCGLPDVLVDPDRTQDTVGSLLDPGADVVDVVVVVFATFADNRVAQALAEAGDVPIVLWSLPERRTGDRLRLNSLCGAHLSAFELARRRHPRATLHLDPGAVDAPDRVRVAIDAARAAGRDPVDGDPAGMTTSSPDTGPATRGDAATVAAALRGATIGVVGEPPPGFTPCEGDDAAIAATTGVRVDRVSIDELFDAADRATDGRIERARAELATIGRLDDDVPADEVERSLRLRAGLAELVEARRWRAVAVRCWPECLDVYGAAMCAPLAASTRDGVPAVCEADLLGALTALLLRTVSGADPFVTDVVDADPTDDTSVLWHCGSASPAWAGTPVTISGHPIKGTGLANEFALRAGPVSVARVSRSDPDTLTLWTTTAELLDRSRPFTGTCGTLRWHDDVAGTVGRLLAAGVEHHVAIAPGDHEATLEAIARRWGIAHRRLGTG